MSTKDLIKVGMQVQPITHDMLKLIGHAEAVTMGAIIDKAVQLYLTTTYGPDHVSALADKAAETARRLAASV